MDNITDDYMLNADYMDDMIANSSGVINATTGNHTHTAVPTGVVSSNTSLPLVLFFTVTLALTVVTISANIVVLYSVVRVPTKTLRSRMLIISTVAADIIFSVAASVYGFKYVMFSYGIMDGYALKCWGHFAFALTIMIQFSQMLSNLGLALDRIYAIVAPMTYHFKGYTTWTSVIIFACIWVIPWGGIFAIIMVASIKPSNVQTGFCDIADAESRKIIQPLRFPLVIAFCIGTFLSYIGVFVAVKMRQRKSRILFSGQQERWRRDAAIAITYFSIVLTTAACYLPWPIYRLAVPSQSGTTVTTDLFLRALINVYYVNVIIDPIIFAYRIPSIRQRLPEPVRHWICFRSKREVPGKTSSSKQTQDGTSVSILDSAL